MVNTATGQVRWRVDPFSMFSFPHTIRCFLLSLFGCAQVLAVKTTALLLEGG